MRHRRSPGQGYGIGTSRSRASHRLRSILLASVGLLMLVALASCQSGGEQPFDVPEESLLRIGRIERLDPALDEIVPESASLELIWEGVPGQQWTEGPVWVPELGSLLYSEIPSNSIHRWRPGRGPVLWLRPSGYTGDAPRGGEIGSNGLALGAGGHLLLAQHGDRRIARLEAPWEEPSPRFRTLAEEYRGQRFNSPNDLAVRRNGDIYFTDPPYGLERGMEDPAKETEWQGVYRLAADESVTLLTRDLSRPNGIIFSPDQKTLYVANSDRQQQVIMAYDVAEDGSVSNGRVFYESWGDGMTVDQEGNLYVAGPRQGVLILSPEGALLGALLGTERTSNCTFGDDGSTLYITGVNVMRIRLTTKGVGFP